MRTESSNSFIYPTHIQEHESCDYIPPQLRYEDEFSSTYEMNMNVRRETKRENIRFSPSTYDEMDSFLTTRYDDNAFGDSRIDSPSILLAQTPSPAMSKHYQQQQHSQLFPHTTPMDSHLNSPEQIDSINNRLLEHEKNKQIEVESQPVLLSSSNSPDISTTISIVTTNEQDNLVNSLRKPQLRNTIISPELFYKPTSIASTSASVLSPADIDTIDTDTSKSLHRQNTYIHSTKNNFDFEELDSLNSNHPSSKKSTFSILCWKAKAQFKRFLTFLRR